MSDPLHDLSERCELCRESVRDRLAAFDRRLLALEIVVRGEDGRNGMKAQLTGLYDSHGLNADAGDTFERIVEVSP